MTPWTFTDFIRPWIINQRCVLLCNIMYPQGPRAAQHFPEIYRFKFQKTNGSSMYRTCFSEVTMKYCFIHPAYPARYCIPSFLWFIPTPLVTPVAPYHPDMFFSRLAERFEHAILDMWEDSVIPRYPHDN